MPPQNQTPHSKRGKGGSLYEPYARPSNHRDSPAFNTSEDTAMADLLSSLDESPIHRRRATTTRRRVSRKVRFHQRQTIHSVESDEDSFVFPPPMMDAPSELIVDFAQPWKEINVPFLDGVADAIEVQIPHPSNSTLPYADLVARINGLEKQVQEQAGAMQDLHQRVAELEGENGDLRRSVRSLRGKARDSRRPSTPYKLGKTATNDFVNDAMLGTTRERGHFGSLSPAPPPSVLVFPSNSPDSDNSEAMATTPKDSPSGGVTRVIDENYDEGSEEQLRRMHRRALARDVNHSLGVDDSMNSDEVLDRIAESMPRVWRIREEKKEQKPYKYKFPPLRHASPY